MAYQLLLLQRSRKHREIKQNTLLREIEYTLSQNAAILAVICKVRHSAILLNKSFGIGDSTLT